MLFHLATRADWDARGATAYVPAGLSREGFVHCSSVDQVVRTANRLFTGRRDLLLLVIEPSALGSTVVWEDLYDAGEDFPHVYGSIDLAAITSVEQFLPDEAGTFSWNPGAG